jgi:hypothetical protein
MLSPWCTKKLGSEEQVRNLVYSLTMFLLLSQRRNNYEDIELTEEILLFNEEISTEVFYSMKEVCIYKGVRWIYGAITIRHI